ncbi:undecaprenyl phosphate translocase family protein [Alienimonas chondri]|uniref:DUF368 domain-containing protein n=1 Tax=Alienimonas chondri TaxID=2681879 RepID=A0ABX1VE12_9PLAN|nr:DUF368 domain-containing protein [Alienimonas chondri]NNJ26334.1 hypothetical protein [Alienimonas chondri]
MATVAGKRQGRLMSEGSPPAESPNHPSNPAPGAASDPAVVTDEQLERDFDAAPPLEGPAPVPATRTLLTGALMGTANLVPGVSGGTMVLVCGLYAHFVDAMAAITQGRFTRRAVTFVALLFAAKFAAMGLLGGPVAEAVVSHHALAYSLFLGMTLAGTPVVWAIFRNAPPQTSRTWWAWLLIPVGAASMAALPAPQTHAELEEDYRPTQNIPLDAAAGAAAYGAMVLPGVSGGTIKLALGRYEATVWSLGQPLPWLGSLVGLGEAAPISAWGPILLPYSLGAIAGLVIVSNLLKWLLQRYERAMAALLLGVLWGSVVPVWPFDADSGPPDWMKGALAAAIGFAAVYALTVWHKRAEANDAPDPAATA